MVLWGPLCYTLRSFYRYSVITLRIQLDYIGDLFGVTLKRGAHIKINMISFHQSKFRCIDPFFTKMHREIILAKGV